MVLLLYSQAKFTSTAASNGAGWEFSLGILSLQICRVFYKLSEKLKWKQQLLYLTPQELFLSWYGNLSQAPFPMAVQHPQVLGVGGSSLCAGRAGGHASPQWEKPNPALRCPHGDLAANSTTLQ